MADGVSTLSPELALAYLAQLTVDVRAAAVRRVPSGELCAGEPGLAEGAAKGCSRWPGARTP